MASDSKTRNIMEKKLAELWNKVTFWGSEEQERS